MATTIKTLGAGLLRNIGAASQPGELILYAAPYPGELGATANKAALVTGMRFFNSSQGMLIMNLYFVRYDSQEREIRNRQRRYILPVGMKLNPGELKVDTTPLVLEPGDGLLGFANLQNWIHYVISGVERDV
jgi:hypothetical protein